MSVSSIDKELKQLWSLLSTAQKESVMLIIKSHLEESDTIIPEIGVSIAQYNKELEEGEAAIDRGEFYTNEQVQELFKKWDSKHTKSFGKKKQ